MTTGSFQVKHTLSHMTCSCFVLLTRNGALSKHDFHLNLKYVKNFMVFYHFPTLLRKSKPSLVFITNTGETVLPLNDGFTTALWRTEPTGSKNGREADDGTGGGKMMWCHFIFISEKEMQCITLCFLVHTNLWETNWIPVLLLFPVESYINGGKSCEEAMELLLNFWKFQCGF